MKYKIQVLSVYEKGHYRDTQEDCIFPLEGRVTVDDRLFMVCDGMGGHEAGEVASQAVCEAMSSYILKTAPSEEALTDEILSQALAEAYNLLDERDPNPESAKKMGTTLALLKLHTEGATIAHIGDSRVYQFRTDEEGGLRVIHKTVDHSLVNDLLRVGELTVEEAENFPRKNVITRAMQSHMDRRPKADISHIDDIKAGDYFLLCSDGMLENDMTDENLCNMIGMPDRSDEEKREMLIKRTADNHDNHSAYLVHILDVDGTLQNVTGSKDESGKGCFLTTRLFSTVFFFLLVIGGVWYYVTQENCTETSGTSELKSPATQSVVRSPEPGAVASEVETEEKEPEQQIEDPSNE